jgi:hypothetical protein
VGAKRMKPENVRKWRVLFFFKILAVNIWAIKPQITKRLWIFVEGD